MSFIETCIRRPVTVTVAVLLLVLFGLLSLQRVPVQLTPTVDQPVVTITTRWFGASPQEIVREVVEEQEDVLKAVAGLRKMTSSAVEGQATIRLEFAVGVDKEVAMDEVRDRLRLVPDYPADVDEPLVEATDFESRDYIAWFVVREKPGFVSGNAPAPGFEHGEIPKLLTFFQENVKPVLERAEGVSEVQVLGGREREVQVQVDLAALASRGLGVEVLARALREENLDVTAGTIDEGKRSASVRIIGQYTTVEQIADTVIAYDANRSPIFVRDVATVTADFKKEVSFVLERGEPVIALDAQREFGTNVIQVMNSLREQVAYVNDVVLGQRGWGIEIQQVYDQTLYINRSIDNASRNLLVGAALAGGVLFVVLRSLGATLVIVVAMPISVIGTILGMTLFGRSLNVISMAGLTFAVGMGIDNAIVVLENIFRHREMGKDRIRAAVEGTQEVWGAIVASCLTNVAVFLPVIFIQEEAGQLFRDLAIALTISFLLYMVIAPTVIPMLATIFLRRVPAIMHSDDAPDTRTGKATAGIGRAEAALGRWFYQLIFRLTGGVLKRVALIVAMIGLSVYLSLAIMPPRDYLPGGNQNFVFGLLMPPPGYNLNEFRGMAEGIDAQLSPWWSLKDPATGQIDAQALAQLQQGWRGAMDQFAIPGMEQQLAAQRESLKAQGVDEAGIAEATGFLAGLIDDLKVAPPPPAIENFFFVVFGNSVFMGGSSADFENVRSLTNLFNGAVQGIPGTIGFFFQQPIFPTMGAGGAVEISLYGEDDPSVRSAAGATMFKLAEVFGGFQNVTPDPVNFNLGRDEIRIVPDRVKLAQAGVGGPGAAMGFGGSATAMRELAQVSVDGLIVGDFREMGQSIDLTVVSAQPRESRTRDQLAQLPIALGDGRVTTVGSIADLIQTVAPSQINHTEEQPSVKLSVQIPQGMTIQQAVDLIEGTTVPELRQAGMIPATVNVKLEGSAAKLQQFMAAFIPGFALAALITYLLLAALFENFLHPITIIASVPFAMVGGFAGLATLHSFIPLAKLDVLTMLGFVILVGTIINNPILIVHQAINFMRDGMSRREAIARSTQTRVRPIFMSVVTSIAGMLPLVIFGGAGSELYRGLGAVLVGGLAVSTLFTLILTPVLMSLISDVQDWITPGRARG
jgi:HAE1 family hydrophobic/amphiphilic exporter-1